MEWLGALAGEEELGGGLPPAVNHTGCRVQGAGYRVQGAGCRVQGAGCTTHYQLMVQGVQGVQGVQRDIKSS